MLAQVLCTRGRYTKEGQTASGIALERWRVDKCTVASSFVFVFVLCMLGRWQLLLLEQVQLWVQCCGRSSENPIVVFL